MIEKETSVIGIIGVGLMGLGIATNILKHGWQLHFLEHSGNQPTGDLSANGAVSHTTAKSLAQSCDVIVLCVTGSPQVEDVLERENGVLAGLRPGTIILDCSTALPHSTRMVADKVIAKGGRFLDCPMTRTPKEAIAGKLNLIVGGDTEILETVRPILACFAENIEHVGTIGDGHAMKLLHNYVSLGFTAILGEAAAAARLVGIDPLRFVEVLEAGAGKGVVLDRLAPFVQNGDASRLQFSIANAAKDMGYYQEMAKQMGVQHHAANGVLGALSAVVESGQGDKHLPELIAWYVENARQGDSG